MKIKAYGWMSGYSTGHPGDDSQSLTIEMIPSLQIDFEKHNFAPDLDKVGAKRGCPFRRKGLNIFIIISWLIFGLTLDFRFGRDTGYWPGNDQP
jgi:hypothetical protein